MLAMDPLFPHSLGVANGVLDLAARMGLHLNPRQLQKILYISHGFCLSLRGYPLVGERFRVGRYFPELPSVLDQTQAYGNDLILDRIYVTTMVPFTLQAPTWEPLPELQAITERVLEVFGHATHEELNRVCCAHDGPWRAKRDEVGALLTNTAIMLWFDKTFKDPNG